MRVSDANTSIKSNNCCDDIDIENPPDIQEDSDAERKFRGSNNVFFLRENLRILDDPKVFREYQSSKKRYFDCVSVIPTLIIIHISVATRYNWSHIASENPCFLVANVFIFVCVSGFWPFFTAHCIIYCTDMEGRKHLPYRMSNYLLHSCFGGRIEDILCISATLFVGFGLLARVLSGQCESTTDIWNSQR